MADLDEYLAPPYADYYKIQQGNFFSIIFNIYFHIKFLKKILLYQAIWKCIWMRYGNRVIRGKVPKAPTEDFDTVD